MTHGTIVSPTKHPIRVARRLSKADKPSDKLGYCLRQVRGCYGIPARASDAAEAWRDAKHKHPGQGAPRGVPIFWTGGSAGHGHVAIATGNGECWSTDIEREGYFDKVPITEISRRWGLTYAGWSEDLNGVRVWRGDNPDEGRGGPGEARPTVNTTSLIWAVAAMFIATVAAVVAIAIGVPESANPGGLVAQLLGSFATLVVALGALFKIGKVEQKVDDSAEDTQRIVQQTNGQLDARIRTMAYASMREALTDHQKSQPD